MNYKTIYEKQKLIRVISMLVIVTVISSLFTGCFSKKTGSIKSEGSGNNEITFPLQEPVTMKYWCEIPANALPIMTNYSESAWYKELEKQTGVKINFIHPASGQAREQLNVMLASNDLPDMIENSFASYSGGILRAFSEGIVVDIKDLQQKYAPNLTDIYKNYPELLMDVETENGNILSVPFIRGNDKLRTYRGPAVRKDWLKDLGIKEPATIDDWHAMLTAFKQKKGASVPLLVDVNNIRAEYGFAGAFGIMNGNFVENGKVVFGPMDPRYKDFLATMKKWYDEGLIYSDFALGNNTKVFDALVTGGQVGSMITVAGGGIGLYMNLMKDKDPKFDLVGVPYPSLKEGEAPKFMHREPLISSSVTASTTSNASVSITSACKQPEIAMAWLDYGYSKKGNMLLNFGVEGESYNMENGYPKFTNLIMNNPDGYSVATIGNKYSRAFAGGPFVQDERYYDQYMSLPQQQESINAWLKNSEEVNKANTQIRGQLTPEESSKIAQQQVEIGTYVDEMFSKFIMGNESLDKFDQYVAHLKQMGIEEIIGVKQTAYDRFLSKFPEAKNLKTINVNDYYHK